MKPIEVDHSPSPQALRDAVLKKHLQARQRKLHEVLPRAPRTSQLLRLLQEVDAALERMEAGTFGVCETCHEDVGNNALTVDPLCRNCIEHLSDAEQRALERDLDLAFQVQRGLLPKPGLSIPGWTLDYHYDPLGPVSGDYCDIITLGDSSALFIVGDVMGKGVAASMFMAQLHAIFRSLATPTCRLEELVANANRVFCEGTLSAFFATAVCGRIGQDGGVDLCNAGHCLPLHVANGNVTAMDSSGLPLGLVSEAEYGSQKIKLERGHSLVLFTDGVVESFNSSGEQYSVARLSRFLAERGTLPASELLSMSLQDVATFRSGAPRTDDVTMMVIRRD